MGIRFPFTLTLGIIIAFPSMIYGQLETLNGLIVTNTGDTLRGYIQKENKYIEYTTCSFKQKLEDKYQIYLPSDIRSYYSPSLGLMLSHSVPAGTVTAPAFVKRIVNGMCRLYKFESSDQKIYFIQKGNTELDQLITNFLDSNNGKSTPAKSDQYKTQLRAAMSDCSSTTTSIDKVDASEVDLIAVVKSYNACFGGNQESKKEKPPWSVAHIGVVAGAVWSTFSVDSEFGSNTTSILILQEYTSAFTYHAGAFVDFDFVRRQRNQSFRIEALYFTARYEASGTYTWGSESGEVNIQQLKLPLTFKQGLTKSKVKPYLLAGISLSFHLNSTSKRVRNVTSTGTTTYENTYKFSSNPVGYFAGLGVKLPLAEKTSTFLEIRGELTPEITNVSLNAGISF
jgi:hypothetical protein